MSSLITSEDSAAIPSATLNGTVAVVDMVGYNGVARVIEQNTGPAGVAELNRQIQAFIGDALAQLPDPEAFRLIARTGDGGIYLFNHAADAHAYACNVHRLAQHHNERRSEATAKRCFRIGLATGEVRVTHTSGAHPEYAGTTIATAVRLESAAHDGGIVCEAMTFAALPPDLKLLYGPEKIVHGKRDETFPARRYQAIHVKHLPRHRSANLLTRRVFFSGAASVLGGAALTAWVDPEWTDPMLHPLPAKRFVALVGWPAPTDSRLQSTVASVVNAIGDELIRAEAFDHDLLILPFNTRTPTSVAELNDIRESLGANLVLAAYPTPYQDQLHLSLRVLAPPSHSLREKTVSVPMDQQLSLPEKAVHAAARLLNVSGYTDQKRTTPGTSSADAFAAFQNAERLLKEDNDTGLEKAIDQYKQAIDLDPKYAIAHARLAVAYCRLALVNHDPAALTLAQENAETAVSLDPASTPAHMALSAVYEDTSKIDSAFAEMKKALASDPSNPQTLTWQADMYARLNRWQDAETTYARVIRARPNYWLVHNQLGSVYYDQAKYRLALREFHAASLAAPKNTYALTNIGAINLILGDLAQAQASLQKSLDIKPTALAASNMAEAFRLQPDLPKAIGFAQQATQLDPGDSPSWLELGDCYSEIPGKKHDALASYEQARKVQDEQLKTDSENGPNLMLLALYQIKCNPGANVNAIIERAEANSAKDLASQITKVRILELTHQRQKALAALQQCFSRGATRFQVETTPDLQALFADPAYHSIAI